MGWGYDAETKTWAVQAYRQGVLVTEICRAVGATDTTVYLWLREAGVPRRKYVRYTDGMLQRAVAAYTDEGHSTTEISRDMGVAYGSAYKMLKAVNVLRAAGRPVSTEPLNEWEELRVEVAKLLNAYSDEDARRILGRKSTNVLHQIRKHWQIPKLVFRRG